MRGVTLIEMLIGVAVIAILLSLAVGLYHRQVHQDIVCFDDAGRQVLFAEDVIVIRDEGGVRISWSDGRQRTVMSGHCEWAPHGESYEPAEIESWQGGPTDRSVQWASR